MRANEKIVQRRTTRQFVQAQPIQLVITREKRVPTARGGSTSETSTLEEQSATLVELTSQRTEELSTELGLELGREHHEVIGDVNLDIEPRDRFEVEDVHFMVVWVDVTHRQYETKAVVEQVR